MKRTSIALVAELLGLVAIVALVIWLVARSGDDEAARSALPHGPEGRTVLAKFAPASIDDHSVGGRHRLAILVTDADSAWLALVHGLRSAGIPFIVTRDWRRALEHRVVVAYPVVSGRTLAPEAIAALELHVRRGGAVVAFGLLGGGLEAVFGVADPVESRARKALLFTDAALDRMGRDAADRRIRLGAPRAREAVVGSLGFRLDGGSAEASFDDGHAAIVVRRHSGGGAAYAVGIDIGDFLLRGFAARADGLASRYVNGYDASSDVLVDWLAGVWAAHERFAVRVGMVPGGRELPVLITHDIDFSRSLTNAAAYARSEAELGVPATYFIQTKTVRDWNDIVFYDNEGARRVAALAAQPHIEIASHTLAHSRTLRTAPFGTGEERHPDYRPFVRGAGKADGVTIAGELRVSKFLLEQAGGRPVVSFRPGHLANPESLAESLAGAGYRWSSSATANQSLTHRPFALTQGRHGRAPTPIFEFPVTVEDELDPPMLDRLPAALALAERVARGRGIFVLLIHTDIAGQKLEFQTRFVDAWKARAWFGTVDDFGRFWSARDQLAVDIDAAGAAPVLVLDAPEPLRGLAIDLPEGA